MPDVIAAYCVPPIHEGIVHVPFISSLMNTISYDSIHNRRLITVLTATNAYIPQARHEAVDGRGEGEKHEPGFMDFDAEWLWFLDYDLVFSPDTLDSLLAVAEQIDADILGGLYFNRFADGRVWPIWLEGTEVVESQPIGYVTAGELRECATVGMGLTLIRRRVFERLRQIHAQDPWYAFGHDLVPNHNGGYLRAGEDVTFCRRARAAGFKVHGTASAFAEHIKTTRWTAENAGREAREVAPL